METIKEYYSNPNAELWSNEYSCKTTSTSRNQGHCSEGSRKAKWRARSMNVDHGVCMSLRLLVISEATPLNSHQHDCLNIRWTHVKVVGRKSVRPQPYTKTYNQLSNAESGRKSFPQRRVYELDIQYQMASSENLHTSNIR